MSAKRAFDVTRKPVTQAPKAAPRKAPARPATSARPKPKPSLRARREAARSRRTGLIFFVIALIIGAFIYGLWRPEVRISEVHGANIPDADGAAALVKKTIAGSYFMVLPRDSIFFYPEKEVRAALIAEYPSLSTVSITRDSFSSLHLKGTGRQTAFYWCGESADSFSVSSASCYEADADGLVFARAEALAPDATSSSPMLRIYAPLEGGGTTYPLKGKVTGAGSLANLLKFITAVKKLGVPVLSTSLQGDEAELFVTPQTRIKYVLGNEEEAARNAQAAFPTLNLLDGSIEYVDLRFSGKIYLKRYE